ncbi:MAG: regulator of sigma E protease [Myxococcota bacterium]
MNILAAVSLVAILVFIHELGHFIVAKLCGVHVKIFSIGFGRRVAGFVHNGTDYRLSLLPFGGYVLMAGADPFGYGDEDDDDLDDLSRSFMRRPVWQRLLIIAAGPAINLIFPVVVFTILFMAGEPQPASSIGDVAPSSPAAEAGLQPGDRITAIDGREVGTWSGMSTVLSELEPGEHTLTIERSSRSVPLTFTFDDEDSSILGVAFSRPDQTIGVDDPASPAGAAGIETGDQIIAIDGEEIADWVALNQALSAASQRVTATVRRPDGTEREASLTKQDWQPRPSGLPLSAAQQWGLSSATLFVANVGETAEDSGIVLFSGCRPGPAPPPSPALENGIEPGDRFFRIDGEPVGSWSDVLVAVADTMVGEGEEATARSISLELIRSGQLIELELTPKVIRDTDLSGQYFYRPILGTARGGAYIAGPMTRQYYPFGLALKRSTKETITISGLIVAQLGKLVTGEAAVDKSLGGPVEIVRQASAAAEKGLFNWVRLMAMLSISLGIVNLVPVPVLDGGQILFFLMEAIRGRPVPHQFRERAQQIGVLFLVALMLAVLVFDIHRLFEG